MLTPASRLRTSVVSLLVFSITHPATTDIYTLSLHDALPISSATRRDQWPGTLPPCHIAASAAFDASFGGMDCRSAKGRVEETDRKSTRLNSSHRCISYAVFCLKKKNKYKKNKELQHTK